jgi:hypothetical protein
MKKLTIIALLMPALLIAATALASQDRPWQDRMSAVRLGDPDLGSGWTDFSKGKQDTAYLLGPGSGTAADFEQGAPTWPWQGWYSEDVSAATESNWHVSQYYGRATGATPAPGNWTAYCGDETIAACTAADTVGGYNNNWLEWLDWWADAPNAAAATTVQMDFYVSYSVEGVPYDWCELQVERELGMELVELFSGESTNDHLTTTDVDFTVNPVDYQTNPNTGNPGIHLRFSFVADGGYSDGDCDYWGFGAVTLDDIGVYFNGGGTPVTFDDFETKQSLGNWVPELPPGAGDFTSLRNELEDMDECDFNYSYQVNFIDDGLVVPGTGGSNCISFCYGPDEYIVNVTGGVSGGVNVMTNDVWSPVIEWPGSTYADGCFEFDYYIHCPTRAPSIDPVVLWTSTIRSINTTETDPGVIQGLLDEASAYSLPGNSWVGGPAYSRRDLPDNYTRMADKLVNGVTHFQVGWEAADIASWPGLDGTPAPYFDNVRVIAFPYIGPAIKHNWSFDGSSDATPERGTIDYGNLDLNWCRFDQGDDVSSDSLVIYFGDSIIYDIQPARALAELTDAPRLYFKLKKNPYFNTVTRTPSGTPIVDYNDDGTFITGYTEGWTPTAGSYAFDLPDTGFIYPGDVLHYYIWAQDAINGTVEPQVALYPADTTGYADMSGVSLQYTLEQRRYFSPTVSGGTSADQPDILYWNDLEDRGGENEWINALQNNGFVLGRDFDYFTTTGAGGNNSNGLGPRTTPEKMTGYDVLLYNSGYLDWYTISPQIANDHKGNDIGLLDGWFAQGNKKAFYTGNKLAFDLNSVGYAEAASFLTNRIGVQWQQEILRDFIDDQTAPLVLPKAGPITWNSDLDDGWIAFGACPAIFDFDGVVETGTTVRIAEFTNTSGVVPPYTYSAGTYFGPDGDGNVYVYMPYDLAYIYTPTKAPAPPSARGKVLRDVLLQFGKTGGSTVDVPDAPKFAASSYPNPFNPNCTIKFTLPKAGNVSLKIYNVRGELVRTLLDEAAYPVGESRIVWEGDNNQGGKVASGVYFYEVRSNGQIKIDKMALVK